MVWRATGELHRLWQQASTPSRLLLIFALFFLFAASGAMSDVTSLGASTWLRVLLAAVFSGIVGVAYLLAVVTHPLLIVVVVAFQLAGTAAFSTLPHGTPVVPPGPWVHPLAERLAFNARVATISITISYLLFVRFVARSGKRYVQLDTEIGLARTIHRTLVPRIDRRGGGFEFRGVSLPSGDVGGDLVDLVESAGGTGWTAYLADVSGHGVHSGVLMGMTKSAARTALATPQPIAAILRTLNDVLFDVGRPQMFVTFAVVQCTPGRAALPIPSPATCRSCAGGPRRARSSSCSSRRSRWA